jgi:phage recombination protein Bet
MTGEFTAEQIEIIHRTVAPNLTKNEMALFIHNCSRLNLDPMARQLYAIKRGGRLSIQTGIDGFRLIAERSGKYAPGRETEFMYGPKGELIGAKVFVKKMTPDGTWHEVSATAFLKEYGTNQALWKSHPHVMLEKVAESRALRRCFPADLSGIYTSEEMSTEDESVVESQSSEQPAEDSDHVISEETWKTLDDFLNGHEELREKLKKLCMIDDLRMIKKSQLESCRSYAKRYLEQ